MSMLSVDMTGLRTMLGDLGAAAEAAARPAAQAAAQVLYDEVKRNVASIPVKTGRLAQSIYQVYSQPNSGDGRATYHVSWNHRKARHGHLVEFGHIQRYVTYMGSDGNFYTAKRPGMEGVRKPSRGAFQAAKDAYYVPLSAPKQVPARSFVRRAQVKFPQAAEAAADALYRAINGT
jgi:Flp pilus assembly protein TadG